MSMTTQTPYYDFTPSEVNRIGRVAPEQRDRLTRALRLGVVAGLVMALVPLCAVQQYAFNMVGRWQRGTSEIDNLVQYVDTLLIAAFVLVAVVAGVRGVVNNLRRQHELAIGHIVHGEGFLRWQGQRASDKYAGDIEERRLYFPLNSIYALFPGRYCFFYLPQTGMLIAAEWIGSIPPHFDLVQHLAHVCGFSFGSLAANRAGQLSPEQTSRLSPRTVAPFPFAFFAVLVIALIFVTVLGPTIGGDVVLAIVGVGLAMTLGFAYAAQKTRPRGPVAVSEGPVRKLTYEVEYVPTHFFEIDGKRFRVPEATYDVLDESLLYRVYYLPRGNRLLSIEPTLVADETLA